ncbi:MAG: DUF2946 family protein [Methylocystis silviterrae]|jgi:hypothetical protein|uniref:DUF2946 family protein n=1 Tax=Methylocystis TaxID=133 RepID=UPI0018C21947|nr:DUF2946 family protein [Methylocystis sp. H4A]MBG0802293.1 hypothetical protein [Methylocystis sp. H4A]
MSARSEVKTSQFSSTAVTLLVAYLFVLQGLAVGVSFSGRGSGLFANTICFSKASGPLSGDPATPARPARHGDVCCVVHCASLGGATAASPFIGETPPAASYSTIGLAFDETSRLPEASTPPLGSRAPPVLI